MLSRNSAYGNQKNPQKLSIHGLSPRIRAQSRQVDPQYDKGTYVLGGLLEPLVAAIVEGRPGSGSSPCLLGLASVRMDDFPSATSKKYWWSVSNWPPWGENPPSHPRFRATPWISVAGIGRHGGQRGLEAGPPQFNDQRQPKRPCAGLNCRGFP